MKEPVKKYGSSFIDFLKKENKCGMRTNGMRSNIVGVPLLQVQYLTAE
jgi:hypothetical protein